MQLCICCMFIIPQNVYATDCMYSLIAKAIHFEWITSYKETWLFMYGQFHILPTLQIFFNLMLLR